MSRSVAMFAAKAVLKYYEKGLTSARAIGRITNISMNTVTTFLTKAKIQNITYNQIMDLGDGKVYEIFF